MADAAGRFSALEGSVRKSAAGAPPRTARAPRGWYDGEREPISA